MKIGPKVYWRKTSGEVIFITPQVESASARETDKADDMGFYPQLKGYDPEQLDVLKLEFNKYTEDFRHTISYMVNPDTKTMEFTYPSNSGSESEKPLIDQVAELRQADLDNKDSIAGLIQIVMSQTDAK
ncbi:hypothetical protein [Paenibacillus peoriae]|uniref:hypothetical protein n=1 Tax=Paenibacillus peoriae TaxID=59893 RepID=UPI00096FA14E|nr:hypothetical protein [Paenibacillus peoriae]OMF31950.1 hypothetical protein BK134_12825 [Paenibacillus peoriae]